MIGNILDYCTISGESVKKFEGIKKYIATGDVIENKIINSSEVDYINKPSRANQIAKEGDVIFAKMKDTKKVIKIDKENSKYIYSTGFYIIKPNEGILTDYIYWVLNSPKFNRDKDKHCKGATQKALNIEGLRKIKINKIPNLEEQQKIVSKLSKIDKIMNKKKKQLMMLDELIKSQFVEMFGNKKYIKKCLKDLSITKGKYGSGSPAGEYQEGKPRYIRITDINEDGKLNDNITSPKNEENIEKYILKYGDVLFARTGATVGKTYKYSEKDGYCIYAGYCIKFSINLKLINPDYIFAFTRTEEYKRWVKNKQRVVAQPNINAEEYGRELMIPVAPITLQNEFSEIVKQIDKQKFEIEKSLKETQELYESLMEKYFG